MKTSTLILLVLFAIQNSFSQTTLSAGDIAILQYNSDFAPHAIKFLALRSMESGTTINFTDNGWTGSALKTNEDTDTWTASGNIKAGDIIDFTLSTITLGSGGDQILAYQGAALSPTFIFALNNQGGFVWQAGSTNKRDSALPTGLTNGINAVALDEKDNYRFKAPSATERKGKRSLILSNICNYLNWNGSNSNEKIFSQTIVSEIKWDGTTWTADDSPVGTPDQYFLTNIRQDYNTGTEGAFDATELITRSGRDLTIASGNTITVENSITNEGNIIIENTGSLVQITPDSPITGAGTYTVNRETTSLQEEGGFTYWSSPLTSSTLGEVANARRYFSFNAATQAFVFESSSTSMNVGVGYLTTGDIGGTYPGSYTASFTGGVPNNGNINTSLSFSNDANATNDWNVIGNPYASAMDADSFLNANSATLGGTIYFWTHNTEDSAGDNTADDYASYNTTGGTAAISGGAIPDGNIASGQGFFAQATAAGNVSFTNAMRIAGNNSTFFRSPVKVKDVEKDRIWLNLTSNDSFNQILIGFIDGATNGIDRSYDGIRFSAGANSIFYSMIEDKPFAIQGRPALTSNEQISLGYTTTKANHFTITIDHTEGALDDSRVVLYDKLLNKGHDLKNGGYTFYVSEAIEVNNRFDLFILSDIEVFTSHEITVTGYKQNNALHLRLIKNNTVAIKDVEIYNLKGALVNRTSIENPNQNQQVSINLGNHRSILLIAKVTLSDGRVLRKKFLNYE